MKSVCARQIKSLSIPWNSRGSEKQKRFKGKSRSVFCFRWWRGRLRAKAGSRLWIFAGVYRLCGAALRGCRQCRFAGLRRRFRRWSPRFGRVLRGQFEEEDGYVSKVYYIIERVEVFPNWIRFGCGGNNIRRRISTKPADFIVRLTKTRNRSINRVG